MKKILKVGRDGKVKANQHLASCLSIGVHGCGNHSDMDIILEYHSAGAYAMRQQRSEEMKEIRRRIGDHGGIRFKGKEWTIRTDGCSNTITSVEKDNYLLIT